MTSRSSHHYVLFKELPSPSLNPSGFGQPVYITKLLASCQPLFYLFSKKYFPRPTSLLKVRPPLSRCSRSIYLFAVFCNYFFMNFICFIRVLYVELTRGTLYLVIFPRGSTSIQNKRRFRAAKKVLFNIYFFGLPERGHHFMQSRAHLFIVARFQCFPQNFNAPVKLVFRNRLVALNKNKFI